jgi:hypothetical protein
MPSQLGRERILGPAAHVGGPRRGTASGSRWGAALTRSMLGAAPAPAHCYQDPGSASCPRYQQWSGKRLEVTAGGDGADVEAGDWLRSRRRPAHARRRSTSRRRGQSRMGGEGRLASAGSDEQAGQTPDIPRPSEMPAPAKPAKTGTPQHPVVRSPLPAIPLPKQLRTASTVAGRHLLPDGRRAGGRPAALRPPSPGSARRLSRTGVRASGRRPQIRCPTPAALGRGPRAAISDMGQRILLPGATPAAD